MKIKSQRDFWAGLMFVVTGVGFAAGATFYSFGNSVRPGPGYFPTGLGVLLAVLGALTVASALTVETEDGEPVGPLAWKPLILIVGTVGVFGWALPHLGLVLALPLLILLAASASGELTWREIIGSVVILTAGTWIVFVWGLGLTLPVWPPFINR